METEICVKDTYFCKSISGEEDENGNYKFEVEASNENLDLQNQITLQSALKESEEYFKTNGVISDDHQHRVRNPDGTIDTHKEKIIGEPTGVRFDPKTRKTYVKGILYAGIEAAKPYIELLKNKSRLVKASIGGIMPHIVKNNDGTETVTSFMWNDLALTCSPVNWTVGSAKFAKSNYMGIADFCKSLEAGYGTDSAEFSGGRALQNEDIEEETKRFAELYDGAEDELDEDEEIKKCDEKILKSCLYAIQDGELVTKGDIEKYLISCGMDEDKTSAYTLEIINKGGDEMKKSHFSSTIDELLKSFKGDEEKAPEKDSAKEETSEEDTLFDEEEDEEEIDSDSDSEEDVKKGCVKKSLDENGDEYLDATKLVISMGKDIEDLRAENERLLKSINELQDNMLEVTKSFGDYLKTPNSRVSVMQKSIDESNVSNKKPNKEDFATFKKSVVAAAKANKLSINEVQYYNNEFQKAMNGIAINPETWRKICEIVKDNR